MDKVDTAVLLTLFCKGDERIIAGRTLLQKTIYFLNVLMGIGIEFVPHYYGPYSFEVAESLENLKMLGYVTETVRYYEPLDFKGARECRIHIYELTEFGRTMAEKLAENEREWTNGFRAWLRKMEESSGGSNYKSLSIAAKMYHILQAKNHPVTIGQIISEAKAIAWDIKDAEARQAIAFLKEIALVET